MRGVQSMDERNDGSEISIEVDDIDQDFETRSHTIRRKEVAQTHHDDLERVYPPVTSTPKRNRWNRRRRPWRPRRRSSSNFDIHYYCCVHCPIKRRLRF